MSRLQMLEEQARRGQESDTSSTSQGLFSIIQNSMENIFII